MVFSIGLGGGGKNKCIFSRRVPLDFRVFENQRSPFKLHIILPPFVFDFPDFANIYRTGRFFGVSAKPRSSIFPAPN